MDSKTKPKDDSCGDKEDPQIVCEETKTEGANVSAAICQKKLDRRRDRRPISAVAPRLKLNLKDVSHSASQLTTQSSDECGSSTATKQASDPSIASSSSSKDKDIQNIDLTLPPAVSKLNMSSKRIEMLTKKTKMMQKQSQQALARLTTQIRESQHAVRRQNEYHNIRCLSSAKQEALRNALKAFSESATSLPPPPQLKSQVPKRSESLHEPKILKPARVIAHTHPNNMQKKKRVSFLLPGRSALTSDSSLLDGEADVSGDSIDGVFGSTDGENASRKADGPFVARMKVPTESPSCLKKILAVDPLPADIAAERSSAMLNFMGRLLDLDAKEKIAKEKTGILMKLPTRETVSADSVFEQAPVISDGTKPKTPSSEIPTSKHPHLHKRNEGPEDIGKRPGSAMHATKPRKSVSPTRPKSAPVKFVTPGRKVKKKGELQSSLSEDKETLIEYSKHLSNRDKDLPHMRPSSATHSKKSSRKSRSPARPNSAPAVSPRRSRKKGELHSSLSKDLVEILEYAQQPRKNDYILPNMRRKKSPRKHASPTRPKSAPASPKRFGRKKTEMHSSLPKFSEASPKHSPQATDMRPASVTHITKSGSRKSTSPPRPKSAPPNAMSPRRKGKKKADVNVNTSLSEEAAAVTERLTSGEAIWPNSVQKKTRSTPNIAFFKYPNYNHGPEQAELTRKRMKRRWHKLSLKDSPKTELSQKLLAEEQARKENMDLKYSLGKSYILKGSKGSTPKRRPRHSDYPKHGGRRKKSKASKDSSPPAFHTAVFIVKGPKHRKRNLITELVESMTQYHKLYADKPVDET